MPRECDFVDLLCERQAELFKHQRASIIDTTMTTQGYPDLDLVMFSGSKGYRALVEAKIAKGNQIKFSGKTKQEKYRQPSFLVRDRLLGQRTFVIARKTLLAYDRVILFDGADAYQIKYEGLRTPSLFDQQTKGRGFNWKAIFHIIFKQALVKPDVDKIKHYQQLCMEEDFGKQ